MVLFDMVNSCWLQTSPTSGHWFIITLLELEGGSVRFSGMFSYPHTPPRVCYFCALNLLRSYSPFVRFASIQPLGRNLFELKHIAPSVGVAGFMNCAPGGSRVEWYVRSDTLRRLTLIRGVYQEINFSMSMAWFEKNITGD